MGSLSGRMAAMPAWGEVLKEAGVKNVAAYVRHELAGLPLVALRLEPAAVERLSRLGLRRIGQLAALPGNTRVCCTHEYTLSNLKFAQAVEPGNAALAEYTAHCQQQRALNFPTLPSSIWLEKQINPFLRSREAAVRLAATAHAPLTSSDDVSVFATLRAWKNVFA